MAGDRSAVATHRAAVVGRPDAEPIGATDAGPIGVTDAGPPPSGLAVFVAIGKFGRITSSCDDGMTWRFNRSDDDGASCVGIDCDHHPGSSTGLTSGDGYVYASFGWGDNPTRLFRSQDGRTWEKVYDQRGYSFAGIAWAGDRLVAGDPTPRYSLDRGVTFLEGAWPDYEVPSGAWPNARAVDYAPYDGGRILLLSGEGGGSWGDTTISRDDGLTYQHPTTLPDDCRGYTRQPVHAGGTWVQYWAGTGNVCASTDGGEHWSLVHVTDQGAAPIHTAAGFEIFGDHAVYRSADGMTWTRHDTDQNIAVAGYNPATGTYVGTGGWGAWYDEQRIYRSSDGLHWTALPPSAALRSHPITHFHVAFLETTCP